jgi:hypothetical protein
MKKIFFLYVTFSLFIHQVYAQQNLTMSNTTQGLYVDKFYDILGDAAKENTLLTYAQATGFNYLALYDLHRLDFTNATHLNRLASFIKRAKSEFGIKQIGATGENAAFFRDRIIAQYNASRLDTLEKFDVLNLEFEYWTTSFTNANKYYCSTYLQDNGLSCDRQGAFTFYIQQLIQIKQLCVANNLLCETYLGWFTQAEAYLLVPLSDRILLHAYVNKAQIDNNPSIFYDYTKQRLGYIANAALVPANVSVLFSSEAAFSGTWLSARKSVRQPDAAYNLYKTAFDIETANWKNKINMVGYQWFTYSCMLPLENNPITIAYADMLSEGLIKNKATQTKIYPNPATDMITIENASNITIVNLLGQIVYVNPNFNSNTLDIQHFPNGTYILKTNNQAVRFVKN